MPEQFQALLNRIQEEGLQKAEVAKREILEAAKAEAKAIVETAKAEAETLKADAQREADLMREKGNESLRQAARDVLLSLRQELEGKVLSLSQILAAEALSAEHVGTIVEVLATNFVANGGSVESMELLVSPEQADDIRATLGAKLAAELKEKVQLNPVPRISGGFKLIFNGADLAYDFSDESLAEALSTFLNPRLAELLTGSAQS